MLEVLLVLLGVFSADAGGVAGVAGRANSKIINASYPATHPASRHTLVRCWG